MVDNTKFPLHSFEKIAITNFVLFPKVYHDLLLTTIHVSFELIEQDLTIKNEIVFILYHSPTTVADDRHAVAFSLTSSLLVANDSSVV